MVVPYDYGLPIHIWDTYGLHMGYPYTYGVSILIQVGSYAYGPLHTDISGNSCFPICI